MSIKYGFFNSLTIDGVKDRLYNAEDITSYFDDIIGSGVFVDPANSLQVMANSGLTVTVKAGRGWIDGHYIKNTEDLAVTIDQADASLNRIDRIVFYLDKINRLMGIRVNKGTAATSPVAPALTRNSNVQEYSLATISIPANATAISQTNITDTRLDSTVCGKVAVLIDQIDTSDIYAQFNAWLDDIEATLQEKNLFVEYKATIVTTGALKEFNIPVTDYVAAYDILNIFINGIRLEASEYTATTNKITLVNPVGVAGTKIEVVVLKNIDVAGAIRANIGNSTGITNATVDRATFETKTTTSGTYIFTYDSSNWKFNNTAVTLSNYGITITGTPANGDTVNIIYNAATDVETLTETVTEIANDVSDHETRIIALEKYRYKATGTNDNIALSNICQHFLEGTNEFAGVAEYAHLEINVEGDFAISSHSNGQGTTASPYTYLDLGKSAGSTSTRTLSLNFRKCSRINITALSGETTVIAGNDITIEGLELVCTGGTATNIFSGEKIIARDCKFNITGSGDCIGGNCCGLFENVRMSITSTAGNAFGYIGTGTGILTVRGGTIYTYTGSSSKESVGLYVQANKTSNVLIADGVNIPVNARSGYYQTDSIKINSGYYSLMNCVLGKAANKYSTGEGKTETGTMIISKVL